MNDEAALYDPEKVGALIREATAAAVGLGCNMLECAQAFRALHASAVSMAVRNATEAIEEGVGGEEPE